MSVTVQKPKSGSGWLEALGAFGPGEIVHAFDKEWSFVFDVPRVMAECEAQCLAWAREELAKIMAGLPERVTPDTLDAALAMRIKEEHIAGVKAGIYKPGGAEYARWSALNEGKLAIVTAALRIRHPEADYALVMRLFAAAPDEMEVMLEGLKKTIEEWGNQMAKITRKEPTPAPQPAPNSSVPQS